MLAQDTLQHSFVIIGGEATSNQANIELTVSYSIGQIFVTYHEFDGFEIAEGVQSAEHRDPLPPPPSNFDIVLYPNSIPFYQSTTKLEIRSVNVNKGLGYTLRELNGAIVMRKEIGIDLGFIEGSITEVNIENRAKGIYVIQVWDGDKILKSLRFIRE